MSNLQSMPTISSLSSSTFSLSPLYVFVLVHLLVHLHLCTCLSPPPPSLPYLYTSSYMFVLVLLVSSPCLSPPYLSPPCLSLPCLPPRCSSTRNWKRLLILICRAAHPLTTTVIPPFPHLKNKKVTSARISLHFRPLPSFANISSIYDPILQPPLIFLCVNISEPFFPCQMRLQMWFSTAECVCVTKNEPLFTNATCP